MKPAHPLWFALAGLAVLVGAAQILERVDLDAPPRRRPWLATSEASARRQAPIDPRALVCFKACHNYERYRAGEQFSHEAHQEEEVGHCHMCHAFSGHLRVTIRRATCLECHEEDEL